MKPKTKQKSKKFTKLEVPILNNEYWVYIIWGEDKKCIKYLRYHFEEEGFDKREFADKRGRCYHKLGYHPVIYIKNIKAKDSYATLAHEACHAIDYVFKEIGDDNRDELFAHSVSAILRRYIDYKKKVIKQKKS